MLANSTALVRIVTSIPLILLLIPATASAQAWGGPKGYLAAIVQYIYTDGGDHLFSTDSIDGESTRGYTAEGDRWYLGETTTNTIYILLEYGLLEDLSLAASIAWVSSKYEGRAPVNRDIDDGEYHSTWQDAGLDVRYHFLDKPLAMTAAIGYGLPVTDYATTGHSTVGRGLDELRLSLYAGVLVGNRGTVHAGYTYGMADETQGYSLHRQLLDLDLGYSLLDWLTLRTYGVFQITNDGLEWASDDPSEPCGHCPGAAEDSLSQGLANSSFFQLGFGTISPISDRLSITANISTTLWGENIEDTTLYSVGMVWLLRSPARKEREWGEDW